MAQLLVLGKSHLINFEQVTYIEFEVDVADHDWEKARLHFTSGEELHLCGRDTMRLREVMERRGISADIVDPPAGQGKNLRYGEAPIG